jgi:hypothetical protein
VGNMPTKQFSPGRDERKWGNCSTDVSVDKDAHLFCRPSSFAPSGAFGLPGTFPAIESLGYFRVSLWDQELNGILRPGFSSCALLWNRVRPCDSVFGKKLKHYPSQSCIPMSVA